MARLAGALVQLLLLPLRNRELWQLTLTCRAQERCWAVASFAAFCELVAGRDPRIGLLGSIDVGKNGRYHVHVLALLPSYREPAELINWWCSVADAARAGQHFRRVRDQQDLEHHVLKHNLSAAGRLEDLTLQERVALVGSLADRVRTVGPLEYVWRSAAGALAVPGVELPEEDADDHEKRLNERLPVPRPGRVCRWCLGPITGNSSAVWCSHSHKAAASNALAREAKNAAFDLKEYVARKESIGFSRVEALRAARVELLGLEGALDDWASKRSRFAYCAAGCGERLGHRVSDRTCGADACRQRLARRACSASRLRIDDDDVAALVTAGYRGVALRLADMITNNGPWITDRLFAKMKPLAAELSSKPRSMAELYRRARVRPLTRFDETETMATWIALGLKFEIIKKELRFSEPVAADGSVVTERKAHQEFFAKMAAVLRKERERSGTEP